MSRDLTNLFIDETFQYLTQISGSNRDILEDGLGNRITELDITASNSISSSHSVTAVSSSYSVTSSYALDNYTAATNTFSDITLTKGDGTTTILDTTPNQMVEKIINRNGFMPKGTPVYVSGSTGDQLNVYGADAGDPNKMPAVFILAQDLDPNEEGLGILSGEITQVNTSAFEDGDEIWVAVGGGYTNQRPTGSNTLVQKLGAVVKAQANGSGVIFGAGRANDVPNIQEGYVWVGDADGVAQQVATASIAPVTSSYALQALSSSYAVTASYALNAGDSFPYTGSAGILGDLQIQEVTGSSLYPLNIKSAYNATDNISLGFFKGVSPSQAEVNFSADTSRFQSDGAMYFANSLNVQPGDFRSIFFESIGDVNFDADRDVNIDANSDVNVTARAAGGVGNVTVEGNNINLSPDDKTQVNGTLYNNIFDTGSQTFQIAAAGVGGLLMGVGGYVGGLGEWNTTAQMTFYGADQAFFSAENDFYIKNIYNDTGSITVWSENALTLRGDTSVEIYGGDPFLSVDPQEQINITGKAFATSIASNINGFSTIINQDTTVRQNIRAFVETPMQVDNSKTITVETGATLKVINEL